MRRFLRRAAVPDGSVPVLFRLLLVPHERYGPVRVTSIAARCRLPVREDVGTHMAVLHQYPFQAAKSHAMCWNRIRAGAAPIATGTPTTSASPRVGRR